MAVALINPGTQLPSRLVFVPSGVTGCYLTVSPQITQDDNRSAVQLNWHRVKKIVIEQSYGTKKTVPRGSSWGLKWSLP